MVGQWDTNVSYAVHMNPGTSSEMRRQERASSKPVRHKRYKLSGNDRGPSKRAYPRLVTRERPTDAEGTPPEPPTEQQQRLAQWFSSAIEAEERKGATRKELAFKLKMSRRDLYRYMDPMQIPKSPRSETIRRICRILKLDYSVPAAIMGLDVPEVEAGSLTEMEGEIRRLKWYVGRRALSPEKRAEYEQRIADLEARTKHSAARIIADLEFEPDAPQREE